MSEAVKKEINKIKDFMEKPPMIALPGGTWCIFCNVELCRNPQHQNSQLLQLVIRRLIRNNGKLEKGLKP